MMSSRPEPPDAGEIRPALHRRQDATIHSPSVGPPWATKRRSGPHSWLSSMTPSHEKSFVASVGISRLSVRKEGRVLYVLSVFSVSTTHLPKRFCRYCRYGVRGSRRRRDRLAFLRDLPTKPTQ